MHLQCKFNQQISEIFSYPSPHVEKSLLTQQSITNWASWCTQMLWLGIFLYAFKNVWDNNNYIINHIINHGINHTINHVINHTINHLINHTISHIIKHAATSSCPAPSDLYIRYKVQTLQKIVQNTGNEHLYSFQRNTWNWKLFYKVTKKPDLEYFTREVACTMENASAVWNAIQRKVIASPACFPRLSVWGACMTICDVTVPPIYHAQCAAHFCSHSRLSWTVLGWGEQCSRCGRC